MSSNAGPSVRVNIAKNFGFGYLEGRCPTLAALETLSTEEAREKEAPMQVPETESAQTERPEPTTDTAHGFPARAKVPKDNRSLFIEAMSDATRRRIAFDVVERNCRMRFRVGEEGIRIYLQVLDLVHSSKVDEALNEFETRFLPMLDQTSLKRMIGQRP